MRDARGVATSFLREKVRAEGHTNSGIPPAFPACARAAEFSTLGAGTGSSAHTSTSRAPSIPCTGLGGWACGAGELGGELPTLATPTSADSKTLASLGAELAAPLARFPRRLVQQRADEAKARRRARWMMNAERARIADSSE